MNDLLDAFPNNSVVLTLISLGALAMALATIWRLWVRPSIDAVKGAFAAARDIADLLRDIRDFFQQELPALVKRVDGIADALEEHIASEDARVLALEQRSIPTEGR